VIDQKRKKHTNEGLKEVGKGFITLANLVLVLFLLNTYLQKQDYSTVGIIASIYAIIMLYVTGYTAINKGDSHD
jgi:hypothetical protein